jgi:ribosomal protein L7Ae-like RNA K-turn-binding protein
MKKSRGGAEQALRLLGLAARAGGVVPGTDRVRIAARRNELQFVLVADDASENAREKLLPLLTARGVPYREVFNRTALGEAVGRSPLSALGLTDVSLARRVRELIGGSGVQE